jgi:hypothetical protein
VSVALPASNLLELYLDESGSRFPDHRPSTNAVGQMNCFAMGGILFDALRFAEVVGPHREFCRKWRVEYPLHSNEIRMRTGNFAWLAELSEETSAEFYQDIDRMITVQPFVAIACVIHRPGYNERYQKLYSERRWMLCKTAYAIVVERAAKFAINRGYRLRVHFESAGKNENKGTVAYHRDLKKIGMPFAPDSSLKYAPLSADDFKRVLLGDPEQHTKKSIFCQIADLVIYPIAKGAYSSTYRPFQHLVEKRKLIDHVVNAERVGTEGIKYSCFDQA